MHLLKFNSKNPHLRKAAKRYGSFMKYIVILISLFYFSFDSACQVLINYSMSDCDNNSYPEYTRNRIVSKKLSNDTLKLSIGFTANCCLSPKPVINHINDTLYIEIESVSKMYCACECCFEANFIIKDKFDTALVVVYKKKDRIIKDKEFQDSLTYQVLSYSNNKFLFPTMEEINSHQISNKLNDNGYRIGLWRIEKNNLIIADIYYSENTIDKQIIEWSVIYDSKGLIKEICSYNLDPNKTICAKKIDYDKLMNNKP